MSKIGISLIIKDDSEAHYLKNLLKSLRRRSDDVFVTITGKESSELQKICQKRSVKFNFFPWINDFAKARQFGFDNLPKEYDYIFTCDADDVIEHAGNLDKIVRNMIEADADFCYITYVTSQDKEYGDTIVNVPRLTKRGAGKWVRPIHEVWVGNNPDNFIIDRGKNVRCIHTKKDVKAGEKRNLDMLLAIKNKTDEDHRYIAAAYISLSNYDKALEHLKKISPNFGFYFNVLEVIANIYRYKRDLDKGVEVLEKMVKQYGQYSDPYFVLGSYLISKKEYQRALDTYLEGFKHPKMPKIMTDSSHNVLINPLGKVAFLYETLGQHEKALWCVQVLNKIAPDLKKVKTLTELITEVGND